MLLILQTCLSNAGALPTALNRTLIFAVGKLPAADKAEAASRGREVRIMDEAMVRGRSLSWNSVWGIAADGVGIGVGLGVDIMMAMGGFEGVMFVVYYWKFCDVRLCNGKTRG